MNRDLAELLAALAGPEPSERRLAAEDLAGCSAPAAVAALFGLLEDQDLSVREAAADSLMETQGAEVVARACVCLRSPEAATRNYAIEILKARSAEAPELMIALLEDEDPNLRKFAVEIIGAATGFPIRQAVPLLVKLLADPNANVAGEAAGALGASGDPAALPALEQSLARADWLQYCAVGAISRIESPEARASLERLDSRLLTPAAAALLLALRKPVTQS